MGLLNKDVAEKLLGYNMYKYKNHFMVLEYSQLHKKA